MRPAEEIKRRNGGKTQAKTDRDTCVTVFERTAGSRGEPSVHDWLAFAGSGAALETSAVLLGAIK